MFIPKLHFMYAGPLDTNRRSLYLNKNLGPYPRIKEVKELMYRWETIWEDMNQNDRVIRMLIDTLGVTVPRDLELHIFGGGLNPMSNPLMIPTHLEGVARSDDDFRDTVIHEIAHRFAGEPKNHPGIKNYWEAVWTEYAEENLSTKTHIIIFAVLLVMLPKLFGEGSMHRFLNDYEDYPDYQKALDIAREKGPETLIKQFRMHIDS